jgi:hypothetical protein
VTLGLAVSAACFIAATGTAFAGHIVFDKGQDIWVAADDGGGAQPLVNAVEVPGALSLSHPYVSADGRTVFFDALWTGAAAERARWLPTGPPGASGGNAEGLYRFANGVASRLWPAPFACPLAPCYSGATEPEQAGDSIVATWGLMSFQACWPTGWCPALASGDVVRVPAAGGDGASIGPACKDFGVGSPSPNPAQPSEILYTGCQATYGSGPLAPALIATSPAGHRVIAYDYTTQRDPSWSLDGARVVAAEDGDSPGLWVYGSRSTEARYAVVQPAGVTFASPRYIGGARIAFAAGGDVWAVPDSCQACAFPGDATRLTRVGGVTSLSWTAAPEVSVRPAPTPTPTSTPTPNPTPSPTPTAMPSPRGPVMTLPSGRVRMRSANTLVVTVGCPRSAGRCTGTLTLSVKRSARRTVNIASARFTLRGGRRRSLTLRVSKTGRTLLRTRGRLSATLAATATDSTGARYVTRRALTILAARRR